MGETVLIAMAVAQTGLGFIQARQQAATEAAIAEREAEQLEENAELAKIQALQEEEERLREKSRVKAAQLAQAAALGFDPHGSRSFLGIQAETDRVVSRDIDNIRLRGLVTVERNLFAADTARFSGQAARQAGNLKAFATILDGGLKIARIKEKFSTDDEEDVA